MSATFDGTVRLPPDQLADLIAARLSPQGDSAAARMLDAVELADALGVARSWA
jgi:hypothetical protein